MKRKSWLTRFFEKVRSADAVDTLREVERARWKARLREYKKRKAAKEAARLRLQRFHHGGNDAA